MRFSTQLTHSGQGRGIIMNTPDDLSPEIALEFEKQRADKAEELYAKNLSLARKLLAEKDNEIDALKQGSSGKSGGVAPANSESTEKYIEHHLEWEPFPLNMLPSRVQDYVKAHAAAKNCDEALIAVPALGALAAAVGNSYSIEIKKSWQEISALWIAVMAPSGSYKTPAIYAAVSPINTLQSKANTEYEDDYRSYELALEGFKAKKPNERDLK